MLLFWAKAAFPSSAPHSDYRQGFSGGCGSSAACHTIDQGWFTASPVDTRTAADYTDFCLTCHNAAGEAHERPAGAASTNVYRNLTGFTQDGSCKGDSHSWNGLNGNAGTRTPTLTDLGGTTHMPGGRVRCQTCHKAMEKVNTIQNVDWRQAWSFQGDRKNYRLLGYTSTAAYLSQYVKVYRNRGDLQKPGYARSKKQYLVSPSEYAYNSQAATVAFNDTQSTSVRIYVDIPQPFLRAGNASNAVCLDCHSNRRDTKVSHQPGTGARDSHPVAVPYGNRSGLRNTLKPSPGAGAYTENGQVLCTTCHDPHNAPSKDGQLLRETDGSALCGQCHDVGFPGYTGALANHNGARHTSGNKPATVCLDCHSAHNSNNILLVRNVIKGKSVRFRSFSGAASFGEDKGDSVCEVCHADTSFHRSSGGGAGHNTGRNCIKCHKHETGFKAKGGGAPCYGCHDGSTGPDIMSLMGLGTSFSSGGRTSRHIIAFDNQSSSSCLAMCHTSGHNQGSPNLNASPETALCNTAECHNGGTQYTSRGNSISIGARYLTPKQHNYTATVEDEFGYFSYNANCTKCHVPHGSDNYPNMRGSVYGKATNGNTEDLCFGCHDGSRQRAKWNIKDLWDAGYPSNKGHYEYAEGKRMNCVKCHGPHGTGKDKMIKDSLGGPDGTRDMICRSCHSGNGGSVYNVMGGAPGSYGNFSAASYHDFGLNVAMGGHTVDLTCAGCHDPHYTRNARLLQDKIVFSGISTVPVQTVSASVQPQGPITEYQGGWSSYCAVCHVSMKETGGQSPYRRHPFEIGPGPFYSISSVHGMERAPMDSGKVSCISCHFTHGSPKHSLLRFQDATTPENRLCLQCHEKGKFLQGGSGSHGGFMQNQGRCSDCHNMHTKANKRLLQESTESVLCLSCHSGGSSKYNVWKTGTSVNPEALRGTGGTFGGYSELRGGNAHSMHDINDEATPAPGGITTQHRCGTCHNPHGSTNYRVLRTAVNNVTGIGVYARTDPEGRFVNYSTGFVKFCTACHAEYKVTDDGNGNWIRHPVGVGLVNYSSERYFYANNTSYRPRVELETGDSISCVSCHYAHGSPADANLKYPGGRSVNTCKTCHNRDAFSAGTPGSHAGFTGNDGSCSDCHSMHSEGNAKLLKSGAETEICVNCHDNPGTSRSPNASRLDIWKGNVFDTPTSWFGTAGSFGTYDPVDGGNATSMHPVNSDARIAPGDSATVVHCGTCHDTHGSQNYRLLKTRLSGKAGIAVTATVDGQGRTVSYGSGMSGFCTACHKAYISYGSAAGYTRHPVDVALTAEEMANYNHFDGRKYLPLEAGNKVTCTTCHFAHGSPNPKMKRLPGNQMCQTCHAKALDPANNYQQVAYTHGGFNGNGGDCGVCHSMHAGNHRKLLVNAEETELCYGCHAPDGSRRGGFPQAQLVWRGDSPSYPSEWDGTAGSFGAFYNTTSGGSIMSHHDINRTDSPAPGGTTTEHRCGTCHNPHGSNNYRLLRDNVNGKAGIAVRVDGLGNYSSGMSSFCTACHATYGEAGSGLDGYKRHPVNIALTEAEYGNLTSTGIEPKASAENRKVMCLSCHFAHGSPSYAMLKMKSYTSVESDICQQCHMKGYNSGKQQVRYTHGGFNGNKANCRVCHSVHSKNNKKLLVEAKESQLCNNCHSGIARFSDFKSHDPDVVIDRPSRFNVFSSIGNSFGNYSVGGGDVVSWHEVDGVHTAPGGKTLELRCGKCHNPHGGDNFVMLRESVEGVDNIKVFGHVSSTGPFNTYSSGFASFCSACHTRLTKCISVIKNVTTITRHPVDFKLKDKQYRNWSTTDIAPRVPLESGSQVTCITCHNSHGSKNYKLQRLGDNDMCQQCHKR